MNRIKAVIEGKSGKIYFSEESESMKYGLVKINDYLNDNPISEPYIDYFVDFMGNKTTVNEFTSYQKPVDRDQIEWDNFQINLTGNPLPNNE